MIKVYKIFIQKNRHDGLYYYALKKIYRQLNFHIISLPKKTNYAILIFMKKDIHPKWHDAVITCACGHTIKTQSTLPAIKIEVCSNCHPFYTGKLKLLDTAGSLEKFKQRAAKKVILTRDIMSVKKKRALNKQSRKPKAEMEVSEKLAAMKKSLS